MDSATRSFQTILELVEALSEEEQDILFDLIHKRRIALRRQEIAQSAVDTIEAFNSRTAKVGSVYDLIADLTGDDE